ncbi:MAG: aminoacyl--tRNA ligase-related protein [bacterium]
MRQSQLFAKTTKTVSKDEISLNAQLLTKAGFVDKLAAGIYTFLPLGWCVMSKIENIIREEMDKVGGQEIRMPALIPKENWEQTDRWETFDALFKIQSADKKEYGMGATHEEVVSPLVKNFVFSYKDLPIYVYQIQTKFRNELRAKSGLMRGREFLMKDLYSFHASEEDLDKYYETQKQAYYNIFARCGLQDLTYITYASGGAFSKYSHEFQTITDAGEDVIYICDKCRVAINKEIIKEQSSCPQCDNSDLKEKKAVEVGNIFKLKTRFSEPFNLKYAGQDGQLKPVIMGCYGIGLGRLMGTIVETFNDDRGIIWPEEIAPFKVHLIEVQSSKSKVKSQAEEIYKKLLDAGIEVLYDDREEASVGEKFADADLIGIPYRLVVSKKTLEQNSVELKKRCEGNVEFIKIDEIASVILADVT